MRISIKAEINGTKLESENRIEYGGVRITLNDNSFSISASESADISAQISIVDESWTGNVFIPALWYNGNMEGEGLFPSLNKAPYWIFDETRMPFPAMTAIENKKGWLFAWLDECPSSRSKASAGWNKEGIILHFPSFESPYNYRGKKTLVKSDNPPLLHLLKGESLTRRIFIKEIEKRNIYDAYRMFLKEHSSGDDALDNGWERYKELKKTRLKNMVIDTPDGNKTLIMGEGNGEVENVYQYTAGSFLVKSLEAAVAFHSGNDQELRKTAITIGKYFLLSETAPGFYQDCINLETGERGGYLGISEHPEFKYLMNARCTGEAMSSFIELYEETEYKPFIEIAKRIMNFYIDNQLDNGSFGRWWDKYGNSVDSKGTNGAYIGSSLIKLLPHIKDKDRVLKAILKARDYYTKLSLSGNFHGDTLDADSTDKEAGAAILAFLLSCHESGYGDEITEKAIINAASFILTWIWQRQSYIPPTSPLSKMHFKSRGMTSVSVAHHHLDFYGMLLAYLFLRTERITKDELWKNQARMMMNACLQLIADESNSFLGRNEKFIGWQPEQINHTYWDYFSEEKMMNGSFGIDIAWVNVLGYSSLLSIEREFPEIMKELYKNM